MYERGARGTYVGPGQGGSPDKDRVCNRSNSAHSGGTSAMSLLVTRIEVRDEGKDTWSI